MPHKPFRFWLILLLLGPTCALALEIGEIQVSSALNQLFDARIPLPKLTPEELAKVSVKLAPPPMFKEFGLDRAPALANLVFSIEYNAEDQVYVRVVSTQPIREPSLALLLEFGWPRGKTFREFTVFLDPVQRLAKRPGDRTRTVLDTPAGAVAGPEATPAPMQTAEPVLPEPEPVVAVAAPEVTEPSLEPPPLPVEAPPPPIKLYKPGDVYGPVASGEGLWAIALKVRPDPGITRDQMMQALFRANPQAFAKTGIEGLKIGATLRIPTFREIADFTGSATARRLAEVEPAETAVAGGPEVFPLAPPVEFEPTSIATTLLAPAPRSIKPARGPVAAARSVAPPVLEPVPATPLLFMAVSEVMASVVQIPAFALPAQIAPAAIIAAVPAPEPARQASAIVAVPRALAAESVTKAPDPSRQTVAADATALASTDEPKSLPAMDVAAFLAALEERISPAVLDLTSLTRQGDVFVSLLPVAKSTDAIQPETESPAKAVESPAAESGSPEAAELIASVAPPAEMVRLVIAELPLIEAAESSASALPHAVAGASLIVETPSGEAAKPPTAEAAESPTADSAKPAEPVHKGGGQYGPVAAKERLWDIAAKVRPDPVIGKDVMVRALFAANPQAFAKPGMDQLKVGATLRIPTLPEIVEYTGSKAAKQLLELQQQQAAATQSAEPAAENELSATSAPAESTETAQPEIAAPAAEPVPVAESQPDAATAPALAEPAAPQATDEALPVAESPLSAPVGGTADSQ